jgi:hypothetical protein
MNYDPDDMSDVRENPYSCPAARDYDEDAAAGGYTFDDTADTIRPTTPEEDAAYTAAGEEIKEDASAILATSRFLLTGYEEQVCEHATGIDNGMFGVDMSILDNLRTTFSKEISTYKNR